MQFWSRPRWLGITLLRRRFELRLVIVATLLATTLYGALRAYVQYEAHRATLMLAEAARVQVGATEASVLQLVNRYGGYKWTLEPLPPRKNWVDPQEYDYQRNPFGLTTYGPGGQRSRAIQAISVVINAIPKRLRAVLGMRDWGSVVDLSIRNGRVQSVSAALLVEGRSEWLGYEWQFVDAMPHRKLQARVFVIDSAFLEMGNGVGMMILNTFTPKASEEEIQVARKFNTACLTSIQGCTGLCDIAPRALEYLKRHPDAGGNIIPPKCH